MFEEIKKRLLDDPNHIVNLLEIYNFSKIKMSSKEIRCAFEEGGNPTAIVIRLQDNDKIFVKDYERNISNDIFGYISEVRNILLKDILSIVKKELNIDSFYTLTEKKSAFGGFFDKIGNSYYEKPIPIINEDILDQYLKIPNLRFLNDGISLKTQEKFGIGYSIETQRITIPIRNAYGELIGIKGRCNYTPEEYEPKYLYLEPCPMSQTLYGYSENYSFMEKNKEIIIFESEKSVMQMDSMGYFNAVAIGSNSLSDTQAKLIMSLQPKKVIFALDNSLPLENTYKNIEKLKDWDSFNTLQIDFFDWTNCDLLDEKDSPTDKGKDIFEEIKRRFFVRYES